MSLEQVEILVVLAVTMILFVWGRFGPDLVALGALLACVLLGLVPGSAAFAGFGHPAVITVACVLVLSRALQVSGVLAALVPRFVSTRRGPTVTILSLTALAALLSSFMNNVGALALLMPVALQVAARLKLPPGRVLLPVAYGAALGGLVTLIGTPPNLIVSGFRAGPRAGFAMFDFAPVGLAVATLGVAFIGLVGWRLVPRRERAGADTFDTGAYLTEAQVTESSSLVGRTLRDLSAVFEEVDAQIVGLVKHERFVATLSPERELHVGDVLVVETEPASLPAVLSVLGLRVVTGASHAAEREASEGAPRPTSPDVLDLTLTEVVVRPDAALIGRSAKDLQVRTRFGINLLAISRQGRRSVRRLRSEPLRAGDVLLLQGPVSSAAAFASELGCVPLAERALHLPNRRAAYVTTAAMAGAVTSVSTGAVAPAVGFALAVLVCLVARVLTQRRAYEAVEWPVIVVLGALLPVAGAMESTGAAALVASHMLEVFAHGSAVAGLVVVLVLTMALSDFINNAATAAVMCPIALGAAAELGANPDTFLMAVAVGASCAFLTPIGHQNNLLVMGPGGFRFGDYWRLGLPLDLVVISVAVPTLLVIWPLH
ncbi:MAG: SLC13 family permease [Planctomycetota bacterium]